MIELSSVAYAYPRRPPIFEDFTWRIERGQTWAVLGPSGCGKTTLLYLLAGLRLPVGAGSRGQVRVYGQPLTRPRPQTGLILQDYGLLPWATVRENAALGISIRRFYGPDGTHAPTLGAAPDAAAAPPSLAVVDAWLSRLGLADAAAHYPSQLSGGQRQRTAIARTLALQPDLLLMDEPFSSLDAPTREGLQSLVLDLCREQALTLVVVTHSIEEAAVLGQFILLLNRPPHRGVPQIVENPAAGQPGHRESAAYHALCQLLRARLREAG